MSEHRDKAVEAALDGFYKHDGRAISRRMDEAIQAASSDLERMYFERFKEAVLSEQIQTFRANADRHERLASEEFNAVRSHALQKTAWAWRDAGDSLEAALSKAQELMEEGS